MKKLEKKLRKLGFEAYDINTPDCFDFKINGELRIRVLLSEQTFNYFNEGSCRAVLDIFIPFSSIKDLKKQVKEKTGIVLKKDKPVTKEELKKYGWVQCKYLSKYMDHPKMPENGISYNCTTKEVTIDNKPFKPCPTMSQLKACVLEHTGEKMQKVKKGKEVTNIDSNIASVSVESLKPIELPKRWEDISYFCQNNGEQRFEFIDGNCNIITHYAVANTGNSNKNTLPQGLGNPILATCQLLLLRDVYRQGWKPDWNDAYQDKYCIYRTESKLKPDKLNSFVNKWSFQDQKTRDLFLENFKPLLEEHYKLYN